MTFRILLIPTLLIAAILQLGCTSHGFVHSGKMAAGRVALVEQTVFDPNDAGGQPVENVVAEAPAEDPAQIKRQIIYTAEIWLIVQSVEQAAAKIEAAATQAGGHLHQLADQKIVVKVPAAAFHGFIDDLDEHGKVSRRSIHASDITEDLFDLKTRLTTNEQMLERLLAMLEKAEKVEDALLIEKEVQRITEVIEMIKGKVRFFESQVALSTLTVHLNSPVPQNPREIEEVAPFPWIRRLGEGLTASQQSYAKTDLGRGIRMDWPGAFVRYYQENYETRAISADNVMIKAVRHDNFDEGSLEFWSELAKRHLLEQAAINMTEQEIITTPSGNKVTVMTGTRAVGNDSVRYMLAIASSQRHVFAIECWGPAKAFDKHRKDVIDAIKTMRVKSSGWF